ncbi:phage/plasmid primase, P4 family [Amycolatopsis sp. NPDC052450]|uniref:DNA primase family protein n=1 Tax=Amycolatopsis sp. NPDC052450 TaxID=3363937 RepID=UPI0037CC0750
MTNLQDWRDAVHQITPESYTTLGKVGRLDDLADRLHLIAETQGVRRFLEHLRHTGVPEDDWARLTGLYPDGARHSVEALIGVHRRKMEGGRALTEFGLADRIADQYAADLAWCKTLGGWLSWSGSRWKLDDGDHVAQRRGMDTVLSLAREADSAEMLAKVVAADGNDKATEIAEARAGALRKFAHASQKAKVVASAIGLVRSEGVAVDADQFDARPELLSVGNGTLELGDTATLREHRRADRLTRTTEAKHVPGDSSADWERLVNHVLPDPKVRAFVQRLAGYSLWGANNRRLMIFMIGKTSSGKSTFLEIIGSVLGEHAGPFKLNLFSGKQTDAARPDIIKALPRRLIHASETSDRWEMHADEIKALTGNDKTEARKMRADTYLERIPAFVPWVACNSAPIIKGADLGLWRRLVAIPCGETIERAKEDTMLAARISTEHRDAVLAWLVEGWNRYQREGIAEPPHAVDVATAQLRDSLSTLDLWLAEATERDVEYSVTAADLWDAFNTWCEYGKVRAEDRLSITAFGRGLTDRGFLTGWAGTSGKRRRTRVGLRLRAISIDA